MGSELRGFEPRAGNDAFFRYLPEEPGSQYMAVFPPHAFRGSHGVVAFFVSCKVQNPALHLNGVRVAVGTCEDVDCGALEGWWELRFFEEAPVLPFHLLRSGTVGVAWDWDGRSRRPYIAIEALDEPDCAPCRGLQRSYAHLDLTDTAGWAVSMCFQGGTVGPRAGYAWPS